MFKVGGTQKVDLKKILAQDSKTFLTLIFKNVSHTGFKKSSHFKLKTCSHLKVKTFLIEKPLQFYDSFSIEEKP